MSLVDLDAEMCEFWLEPMHRFMSLVCSDAERCELGYLRCGGF